MDLSDHKAIEEALRLVGELLDAEGEEFAIVILGGAALNLLGIISRTTTDVDIVAFSGQVNESERQAHTIREPPDPMPGTLVRVARTVARDLGLAENWLNTGPALQWRAGLPPGLESRIHWRRYSALEVGIVDRYDLIFFKLFAAADSTGTGNVHYRDLIALCPTQLELKAATSWVATQDASPEFALVLEQVSAMVRRGLDHE